MNESNKTVLLPASAGSGQPWLVTWVRPGRRPRERNALKQVRSGQVRRDTVCANGLEGLEKKGGFTAFFFWGGGRNKIHYAELNNHFFKALRATSFCKKSSPI